MLLAVVGRPLKRGPFFTLLLALFKRDLTARVYIPKAPPNPTLNLTLNAKGLGDRIRDISENGGVPACR